MAPTKNVSGDNAPLEHYVRKVMPPGFNDEIFQSSPYTTAPTLVKGKVCRILTYRGCFNPSHQGHMDALCHGFFRSGTDVNIVAAITFLLSAESLAKNFRGGDGIPLLLTHEERASLFNDSCITGGWHWCHLRGTREQDDFERKLKDAAAEDGFEIDFVTLTGPDHVSDLTAGRVWKTNTIVVGTGHTSRTSFRADNASGLSKVGGYSEWVIRCADEKLLDDLSAGGNDEWIKKKMLMLAPEHYDSLQPSGEISQEAIADFRQCLSDLGPLRECRESAQAILRYIPTHPFGPQAGAGRTDNEKPEGSSTSIREIIFELGMDNPYLVQKLAGKALATLSLSKILRRHHKLMEQARELHPDSLQSQISAYKLALVEKAENKNNAQPSFRGPAVVENQIQPLPADRKRPLPQDDNRNSQYRAPNINGARDDEHRERRGKR